MFIIEYSKFNRTKVSDKSVGEFFILKLWHCKCQTTFLWKTRLHVKLDSFCKKLMLCNSLDLPENILNFLKLYFDEISARWSCVGDNCLQTSCSAAKVTTKPKCCFQIHFHWHEESKLRWELGKILRFFDCVWFFSLEAHCFGFLMFKLYKKAFFEPNQSPFRLISALCSILENNFSETFVLVSTLYCQKLFNRTKVF